MRGSSGRETLLRKSSVSDFSSGDCAADAALSIIFVAAADSFSSPNGPLGLAATTIRLAVNGALRRRSHSEAEKSVLLAITISP